MIKGDTDVVPRGTGTYGSKSTQIGGAAAGQASEEVVESAKELAADELEASAEDMVLDLDAGRFHVAGAPEPALELGRARRAARESTAGSPSSAPRSTSRPSQPTFPFGAHVAVVEVDTETGAVELQRMVAVDDAGTDHQPAGRRGPGPRRRRRRDRPGAVRGARATTARATPRTRTSSRTACRPRTELPSFELVGMETPTPINPLGAKGIGESGTIGATPAVQNAVIDALSHLGVRHIDMPVNGERVWRGDPGRGRERDARLIGCRTAQSLDLNLEPPEQVRDAVDHGVGPAALRAPARGRSRR